MSPPTVQLPVLPHRAPLRGRFLSEKIKLKPTDACLYQCGLSSPDIPKLTKKQCRYKDEYYMELLFHNEPPGPTWNCKCIGATNVSAIIHDMVPLKVDGPFKREYDKTTAIISYKGYPTFPEPPELSDTNYDPIKYRKQFLSYIKSEASKFDKNRRDICSFMSSRAKFIDDVIYTPKIVNGEMMVDKGLYIKCRTCDCISYIQGSNAIPDNFSITKQIVCDIVNNVANADPVPEDDYSYDALGPVMQGIPTELELFCSMVCGMSNQDAGNCYNCGANIQQILVVDREPTVLKAIDKLAITGNDLKELTACLRMDKPPPSFLTKACKIKAALENRNISVYLNRQNNFFINTRYNISFDRINDMDPMVQELNCMIKQPISNEKLYAHEISEMLIVNSWLMVCGSELNYEPTSINLLHSFREVCHCQLRNPWWNDIATPNMVDDEMEGTIVLRPLHQHLTWTDIIGENIFVLLPNPENTGQVEDEEQNYITPVTGSDKVVIWNGSYTRLLANNAIIEVGGEFYRVDTMKSTAYHQLVRVVKTNNLAHSRLIVGKSTLTVKLPTFSTDKILKMVGIFGDNWQFQELNVQLVHRLLVHCITGQKSMDSMLSYIAGLSNTSYVVGGKFVDLTNIKIQDGIPELIFVLLILNEKRKLISLMRLHCLYNFNVDNTIDEMVGFLVSRFVLLFKQFKPDWYQEACKFFENHLALLFRKDLITIASKIDVDLKDIFPYKVIDGYVSELHSNLPVKRTILNSCYHHTRSCAHNGTEFQCVCCSMFIASESKYCTCCAARHMETHTCEHLCVNKHRCSVKTVHGSCNHWTTCVCCGVRGCEDLCGCCTEKPSVPTTITSVVLKNGVENLKPMTVIKASLEKVGKNMFEKAKNITRNLLTGKRITKFEIDGEVHECLGINKLRKLTGRDLFTCVNGEIYVPNLSIFGDFLFRMTRKLVSLDCVDRITESEFCLLHCFSKSGTITFPELMEVMGHKPSHDYNDLVEICKLFNVNAVCAVRDEIHVIRYGSMLDNYMCIAHGSAYEDTVHTNHWNLFNFDRTLVSEELPSGVWDDKDLCNYSDKLRGYDTLICEASQLKHYRNTCNRLLHDSGGHNVPTPDSTVECKLVDGNYHITNSAIHKIQDGFFNFTWPSLLCLEEIKIAFNESVPNPKLCGMVVNVDKDATLVELLVANVKLLCRRIHQINCEGYKEDDIRSWVPVNKSGGLITFQDGELPRNVKPGDHLVLKEHDNKLVKSLVFRTHKCLSVLNPSGKNIIGIGTTKESFGSMMRSLYTYSNYKDRIKRYETCNLVLKLTGVAGSGKTKTIKDLINKYGENCAVVCKLSSGYQQFMGTNAGFVGSVEKFMSLDKLTIHIKTLIVDEASLISELELALMCHQCGWNIIACGDPHQVAVLDFFDAFGYRVGKSILEMRFKEENTLTKSVRLGDPLVTKYLSQLYPIIEPNPDHHTYCDFRNVNSLKEAAETINELKIDTVYCYYNKHHVVMRNLLLHSDVRILKVHADQGSQGVRVAVIHFEDKTTTHSIINRKDFLTTALTRGKELVVVLSNSTNIRSIQDMIDCCIVTGSGLQDINLRNDCEISEDVYNSILHHLLNTEFYPPWMDLDILKLKRPMDPLERKIVLRGLQIGDFSNFHVTAERICGTYYYMGQPFVFKVTEKGCEITLFGFPFNFLTKVKAIKSAISATYSTAMKDDEYRDNMILWVYRSGKPQMTLLTESGEQLEVTGEMHEYLDLIKNAEMDCGPPHIPTAETTAPDILVINRSLDSDDLSGSVPTSLDSDDGPKVSVIPKHETSILHRISWNKYLEKRKIESSSESSENDMSTISPNSHYSVFKSLVKNTTKKLKSLNPFKQKPTTTNDSLADNISVLPPDMDETAIWVSPGISDTVEAIKRELANTIVESDEAENGPMNNFELKLHHQEHSNRPEIREKPRLLKAIKTTSAAEKYVRFMSSDGCRPGQHYNEASVRLSSRAIIHYEDVDMIDWDDMGTVDIDSTLTKEVVNNKRKTPTFNWAEFMDKVNSNKVIEELKPRTGIVEYDASLGVSSTFMVTYGLSYTQWERFILMCECSLHAECSRMTIPFNFNGELIEMQRQSGCCFFSGAVLKWSDGTKICISSAHTMNMSVVSYISGNVRCIYGPMHRINEFIDILSNHNYWAELPTMYFIKKFIGRLEYGTDTITSACLTCSKPDFGSTYTNKSGELNAVYYSKMGVNIRDTHHTKLKFIFYREDNEIKMYPSNVTVNNLNATFKYMTSICGNEDHDLVESNIHKADMVVSRKLTAEEKGSIKAIMPQSLLPRFGKFIDRYISNAEKIIPCCSGVLDDTIASLVHAVFLNELYKVFKIKELVIHGVDAITVVNQGHEEYCLVRDEIHNVDINVIMQALTNKLEKVLKDMEDVQQPRPEVVARYEKLSTKGIHITDETDGKIHFYGVGSRVNNNYQHVFFVECDVEPPYVVSNNGDQYLVGDNGRQINTNNVGKTVLGMLGNFRLCKLTRTLPFRWIENYHVIRNELVFADSLDKYGPVIIKEKLFNKAMSKASYDNCGFNDLVSYLRTQASTNLYTAWGVSVNDEIDPNNIHEISVVTLNIVKRNRKLGKMAERIVGRESIADSGFFDWLKSNLISMVMQLLAKGGHNFIRQGMEFLQGKLSSVAGMDEVIDCLSDVEFTLVPQHGTLVGYRDEFNDTHTSFHKDDGIMEDRKGSSTPILSFDNDTRIESQPAVDTSVNRRIPEDGNCDSATPPETVQGATLGPWDATQYAGLMEEWDSDEDISVARYSDSRKHAAIKEIVERVLPEQVKEKLANHPTLQPSSPTEPEEERVGPIVSENLTNSTNTNKITLFATQLKEALIPLCTHDTHTSTDLLVKPFEDMFSELSHRPLQRPQLEDQTTPQDINYDNDFPPMSTTVARETNGIKKHTSWTTAVKSHSKQKPTSKLSSKKTLQQTLSQPRVVEDMMVKSRRMKTCGMLFVGSVGDYRPLYMIYKIIKNKFKMTILKPGDLKWDFSGSVVVDYIDSYENITRVALRGNAIDGQVLGPLLRNIMTVHKFEFDVTVGMFFSAELKSMACRELCVQVVPQFSLGKPIETFAWTDCNMGELSSPRRNVSVYTLPIEMEPILGGRTLGWPLCAEDFTPDYNTLKFVEHCINHNKKYELYSYSSVYSPGFLTRLQDLVLARPQSNFLVALGGNSWCVGKTIKCDGESHKIRDGLVTDRLYVVMKINFIYIMNLITAMHHHGGAGCMFTAMFGDCEQYIIPVGVDQPHNAEAYDTTLRNMRCDLDLNFNEFMLRTKELFGIHDTNREDVCVINRPNLIDPELFLFKPKYNGLIQCKQYNVVQLEVKPNRYKDDCILHCILNAIENLHININPSVVEKLYEDYKMTTGFSLIEHVVMLLLGVNLNCNLVHKKTLLKFSFKSDNASFSLHIDDEIKHCSLCEVEFEEMNTTQLRFNWMNCSVDGEVKETLRMFNCLNDLLSTGKSGDPMYGTCSSMFSHLLSNLKPSFLKTWLRKATSINVLENSTSVIGGVKTMVRLPSCKVILLIGEKGCHLGITLRDCTSEEVMIYTGERENYNCCLAVQLHNLPIELNFRKIPIVITSNTACLNQSTLRYCRGNGIPVNMVANKPVELLYIHNTYNRQHHLEPERELIVKSTKLQIVPKDISHQEKLYLRGEHIIKGMILQGNYKLGVEINEDPVKLEMTVKFLQMVLKGNILHDTNLYVITDSHSGEVVEIENTLIKVETQTENNYYYAGFNARNTIEEGTIFDGDKLLSVLEFDHLYWVRCRYTKWLNDQHVDITTCKVVKKHINAAQLEIRQLISLRSDKIIFTNNWILVYKNLMMFSILPEGAGIQMVLKEMRSLNNQQTPDDGYIESTGFSLMKHGKYTSDQHMKNGVLIPLEDEDSCMYRIPNSLIDLVFSMDKLVELGAKVSDNDLTINAIEVYKNIGLEMDMGGAYYNTSLPDAKTIDYWDNTNDPINQCILPRNYKMQIKSSLFATTYTTKRYLAMIANPTIARPSLVDMLFEEFNSFSNRQGSYKILQTKKISTEEEVELWKMNYVDPIRFKKCMSEYSCNPITFDAHASYVWALEHNYPEKVLEDIKDLHNMGWERNPINKYAVHGKVEQTTKMDKLSRWYDEVVSRSIISMSYAKACIFGPPFLEVKRRLQNILREDVIYVDGLTVDQLNAKLQTIKSQMYVVEDDLSAQDCQTTKGLIRVEFSIYGMLGMDTQLLKFYEQCHYNWSWKGHLSQGLGNNMRLTGQTTTAVGNAITNMVAHNVLISKNRDQIGLIMILGDDFVATSNQCLDVTNHGTITKEVYNMISKLQQQPKVGSFLSMLLHTYDEHPKLVPWFHRMSHRYSLCNYSYTEETMKEKIDQRTLSYCHMLGGISGNREIATMIDPTTKIESWYDVHTAVVANAAYEKTTISSIENHINSLLKMMKERNVTIYEMQLMCSDNLVAKTRDRIINSNFVSDLSNPTTQ